MKFSFEAEQYRKNLADELKEKRAEDKDEAKELLANEKETKRYIIAKDIKRVSDEIRKVKIGEDNLETGEVSKEMDVEIETFDLSDIMPEDLKLYFDSIRLKELKESNKGRSLVEFEKQYSIKGEYRIYSELDAIGISDLYSDEFTKKEAAEQEGLREKIQNFIKEITNGAYTNPEMLIHVVGAYHESQEFLLSRYPHEAESGILKEEFFDPKKGRLAHLFFSPGCPWDEYKTSRKPIVIVDPKSKRFQKNIRADMKQKVNEKIAYYQKGLKDGFSISNGFSHTPEVLIGFEGSGHHQKEGNKSWADIADWIVDLYHSRLYKITEKEKSKTENL